MRIGPAGAPQVIDPALGDLVKAPAATELRMPL